MKKLLLLLILLSSCSTEITYHNAVEDAALRIPVTVATYTYGPLLGLFAFGIFTNFKVKDNYVWIVAMCSVLIIIGVANIPPEHIFGYKVGYELLPINGLITFLGLILIRRK